MSFRKLPTAAKLNIIANALIGVGLLGYSLGSERVWTDVWTFGLLVLLATLANLPSVDLTVDNGRMSLSNTVVFLSILLRSSYFEPMVVAAISGASATTVLRPKKADGTISRLTWYKPALTVSNLVQSTFVASWVWHAISGPTTRNQITGSYLVALVLMSGSYYLVNTVGISFAMALAQRLDLFDVWKENFLWTFPGCLCAVSAAGGAAWLSASLSHYHAPHLSWIPFLLLLPPIYVVYYSYKLYLDKIRTELEHVRELNELNARVISTLAMTIEAKDRYTHKHVERVREYALGIAAELGVTGPELNAVRIGAMVHDIGKIAIPEIMLTKPTKLTKEEHERMQSHVQVGVKILEAVNFPFPVTDAVAAHHERWDGNGYPHGWKGEEIPLVGRIVALADGFDALTMDRHYRKAMSHSEALELIESQTGQHYDPKVVEALNRALTRIKPIIDELNQHESDADEVTGQRRMIPHEALDEIAYTAEEAVVLAEISLKPNLSYSSNEVIDLLLEKVQNLRLLPATAIAVFTLDEETNEIHVKGSRGMYQNLFTDLSMKVGEGVSGWVVGHGQAILNEPAAGDLARRVEPGHNLELNSTLSVPLQIGVTCIGAITLYHTGYNLYNSHHQRLLTTLAEHASGALDTLFQLETNQLLAHTDSLTGLPNMRFLIQQLELLTADTGQPFSVLLLDLNDFKKINDTKGHLEGDRVLRDVAEILSESICVGDNVGRYAGDEFVIICKSRDKEDAARLSDRIRQNMDRYRLVGYTDAHLTASIGYAHFPLDGADWRSLLSSADRRMYRGKQNYHGLELQDEAAAQVT